MCCLSLHFPRSLSHAAFANQEPMKGSSRNGARNISVDHPHSLSFCRPCPSLLSAPRIMIGRRASNLHDQEAEETETSAICSPLITVVRQLNPSAALSQAADPFITIEARSDSLLAMFSKSCHLFQYLALALLERCLNWVKIEALNSRLRERSILQLLI
jgi:hypothetical protein